MKSNSQSYIKFMDGVAHKAARTLAETGRITVAVKDNGSLHISMDSLARAGTIHFLFASLLFGNESD